MISSYAVAVCPDARLIAASTLSFGMFTARAFWITRRSAGLECGSVPPAFTATTISLLMRENALDMRSQRANIVCLRTSKILPMGAEFGRSPRRAATVLRVHRGQVVRGQELADRAEDHRALLGR